MEKSFFLIIFTSLLPMLLISEESKKITPDIAEKMLMEGNKRFVNNASIHPNQAAERREDIVKSQNPFAIIVGCSDSRVPPEIIFDQGLGDLFVVRVAGNVVGPLGLDSIEFSAERLKTPLILVLGHQNCGAVRAVLNNAVDSNEIENIAPFIQPAVEKAKKMPGDMLENAIKLNVELVIAHLKSNPILSRLIKENKLKIIGGYYELSDGRVLPVPKKS